MNYLVKKKVSELMKWAMMGSLLVIGSGVGLMGGGDSLNSVSPEHGGKWMKVYNDMKGIRVKVHDIGTRVNSAGGDNVVGYPISPSEFERVSPGSHPVWKAPKTRYIGRYREEGKGSDKFKIRFSHAGDTSADYTVAFMANGSSGTRTAASESPYHPFVDDDMSRNSKFTAEITVETAFDGDGWKVFFKSKNVVLKADGTTGGEYNPNGGETNNPDEGGLGF